MTVHGRFVGGTVLSGLLVLSGCAAPGEGGAAGGGINQGFQNAFNNPAACSNNSKDTGAVFGVLAGAAIGLAITHNLKGALLGGAAGGVTGFAIGAIVDSRRCQMYRIAQAHNLRIASATITTEQLGLAQAPGGSKTIGTNVVIQDDGQSFQPGTADLTPDAQSALGQITQQYSPQAMAGADKANATPQAQAELSNRAVLVVSHTTASDAGTGQNQEQVSTDRARAIAQQLAAAGVPSQNIYYQGAGDSQSAVQNDSPQAKSVNSSVQIIDLPNRQAMSAYLQNSASTPAASAIASGSATAAPASAPAETRKAIFDFGGRPASADLQTVDIGPALTNSTLGFINTANASTPMNIKACTADEPHRASAVINFATGDALPVRSYLPGFYGAPWAGGFNGNLVDVLHVYVPRDADGAVPKPKLEVYRNYHNGMQKPTYASQVPVSVYRGQTATLYRLFPDGAMDCMDVVVPSGSPRATGTIYYHRQDALYVADGALALQQD